MPSKERLESGTIAPSNLAQHPPNGLMNQIMPIAEKHFCKAKRIGEVTLLDIMIRSQNGDAAFPDNRCRSERIEKAPISMLEVSAHNAGCREVYEVPAVDRRHPIEIQPVDGL